MKNTTGETTETQGVEVVKKEHPSIALKMLAQKAKALERLGLIEQDDVNKILEIHQKAAIKYMQG